MVTKYLIGVPLAILVGLIPGVYFGSMKRMEYEAQRQQPIPVVTTVVSNER